MPSPMGAIHEVDLSYAAYRYMDEPKGIVIIWRGEWEGEGFTCWNGAEWTSEPSQVYAEVSAANFEQWVRANIEMARSELAVSDARS